MNPTYTLLELRRITRNYTNMFFTAVLPAFFYIIFGASADYENLTIGNGNVSMFVMIGMASYGAVIATTNIGGNAALERQQGWGRQLGLTPLSDAGYIGMKAVIAMAVAAIPIILIYGLGIVTGARGSALAWTLSALICLAASAIFALYGLLVGTALPSEAAVGAASGSIVIFAFLGNLFIPLSGVMLSIAKFTPLYGYTALARYPLTGGVLADGSSDPLWVPVTNVLVWFVIFGAGAVYFVRRGRERQ
ncbi:MAG: transporter [Humibacillus sp.]|nr:transporter [Humibacillus sp.]